MFHSRGYSDACYNALETAYFNLPTNLQVASYDVYLIDLVRKRDLATLHEVMQCGISLNPCNSRGESLVHTICRRGDAEALKILVDLGCSLQVSDDYGRTPLHDACWCAAPCFDVIEIILRKDRHLLHITDCRGATPLSYVRKENWADFLTFLGSKKDVYWPPRNKNLGAEPVPELATLKSNSLPIPDPQDALRPEFASMVASGKMMPHEAEFLRHDDSDEESSTLDDESESEEDTEDDSESDSSYDSDDDEDDVQLEQDLMHLSKGTGLDLTCPPTSLSYQSSWGLGALSDSEDTEGKANVEIIQVRPRSSTFP